MASVAHGQSVTASARRQVCCIQGQRAVVRFLWTNGLSTEVHREMRPMYDKNCLSQKAVYPASASKKKFKTIPSAYKVMQTVFWDTQDMMLLKFQPHGQTMNAPSYCTTLREL
ncbi:hypothetical protein ANN_17159 [Periplaneta americana]|uniref:Uncharacterized protein n=1 Tax=Periplaneta americana TaxID=6978 RepID=A0ABQ8STF6_PERAM|nr:hypothetical protein ANN_17159 [Periplaneta americana]